jgi:Flp pilus assembly pilin Flp
MSDNTKPQEPALLVRFASDEQAATSVEYALIGVVIAVPLLAMLVTLRDQLQIMLTSVADAFVTALG